VPHILDPTIGKIVTSVVYDGVDFHVPRSDPAGELQIDVLTSGLPLGAATQATLVALLTGQAPLGKDRSRASLWDTVVAAGATQAVLASTVGSGYVTDVMFKAKSVANTVNASSVLILLDGAQTAVFILDDMLYLNGGAVLGFADIECFMWDTTTHEFWVHWRVEIPFQSSIKVDVRNADGVNAATLRVAVIYRLDP